MAIFGGSIHCSLCQRDHILLLWKWYDRSLIILANGFSYYGLNDFSLRWIAESNWTYVSAPIEGLSTTSDTETWLLFNGLDTFTSIAFCGQHVAATNNQFRQYHFDVSSLLINCTSPVLCINFGSAPLTADAIAAEPGQEVWPFGVEITFEFPNRQFIRKEQSDFGWDWGPGFAPAGPWQPAYIIQLASRQTSREVFVRNADLDISRLGQLNNLPPDQGAPWFLNASLDILGHVPEGATLRYSIAESFTRHIVSTGCLTNVTTTGTAVTGTAILDPAAYKLWWPRGLGPQSLYNITIKLHDSSNRTIASVNRRMGFRTIVGLLKNLKRMIVENQGLEYGTSLRTSSGPRYCPWKQLVSTSWRRHNVNLLTR